MPFTKYGKCNRHFTFHEKKDNSNANLHIVKIKKLLYSTALFDVLTRRPLLVLRAAKRKPSSLFCRREKARSSTSSTTSWQSSDSLSEEAVSYSDSWSPPRSFDANAPSLPSSLETDSSCSSLSSFVTEGVNGVNRLVTKGEKYYRLPTTDKTRKNYWLPTKKKMNRLPTWTAIIDICFQKEEIRRAFCIFSSLRSNHIKGNYRISCHLLTFWPEERGIILQNNFRYSSPRNLPL